MILVPPIPIFGGGDCYSARDYWSCVEKSGVDGVMIGRGALIKPWIFTEIKERREWDISSRERLDILRNVSSCVFHLVFFSFRGANRFWMKRMVVCVLCGQVGVCFTGFIESLITFTKSLWI